MERAELLALQIMKSGVASEIFHMYAGLLKDAERELVSRGFERISANSGDTYTDSGGVLRPIQWVDDVAYALSVERHTDEVEKSIAAARRNADSVPVTMKPTTVCPALIDGQLCGGTLSATHVCPKCALGKQGVAQIVTCDVCGAQTAVMR